MHIYHIIYILYVIYIYIHTHIYIYVYHMRKDARDHQPAELPRLYVKPKDNGPVPKEWLRKTTLQVLWDQPKTLI